MAIGRALGILDLQVRQQAFTLAISDSFMLIAWSSLLSLILIACASRVPIQLRQVSAAAKAR
jgi:MFS transporter, DHA2 family, multidrug resistance protein